MDLVKGANLALRFLLEVSLIVALGFAGFNWSQNPLIKYALLIILPASAVFVWGIYIAPKSAHALTGTSRIVVELALFCFAIAALYMVGQKQAALIFAIVVTINEVLLSVWNQR